MDDSVSQEPPLSNPNVKRCPACGEEKLATAEFFYRRKASKDGWVSQCKECTNKSVKTYGQEYRNRPEIKERKRAYQHVYKQEYRRRPRAKELQHSYEQKFRRRPGNAERQRAYGQNSRARRKGVSGSHTSAQIQEQLTRQKCKCYYCNKKFKQKYIFHVEHTFPLSRVAGIETPANAIDYLVLACPHCNEHKGNKLPHEFYEGGRLL